VQKSGSQVAANSALLITSQRLHRINGGCASGRDKTRGQSNASDEQDSYHQNARAARADSIEKRPKEAAFESDSPKTDEDASGEQQPALA
jgi:hypothetical protein